MNFKQVFLFLLIFSFFSGTANEKVVAIKTNVPPNIDGILDDETWNGVNRFTEFTTFSPDFDKEMPEKTEAWLTYDHENLYFAFRCYDSEPNKIKATVSARDQILSDDFVCINLDSHNDQQSLYAFYVNPLGIQADTRFAAGKEDLSVDLVWYSAGRLTNEGYEVEMSIPLKSIRFFDTDTVTMGLFIERAIARNKTHGSIPRLDPEMGFAFLTQLLQVKYPGLKQERLWGERRNDKR